MNDLLITYTHIEEEWAVTKCKVIVEFDKKYPMQWMRRLFELKHINTPISNKIICKNLNRYSYLFVKGPSPEYIYHICENCSEVTTTYLNNIYTDMLNLISNSVYELMLCLKEFKLTTDMVKLIGKTIWNTRWEIIWLKLKK